MYAEETHTQPVTVARVLGTAVSLVKDDSVKEQLRLATVNSFGEQEWPAMETLLGKESGLNPYAVNKTSGACGIFQALPCSKLPCELSDVACQANWGMNYIKNRYGSPSNALDFHHRNNWY